MSNNLVVSFSLHDSSTSSTAVADAIAALGEAARIFSTTWYVRSNLTASEAAHRVWIVMDRADALFVIDAGGNEAAMFNVDENVLQFMTRNWHFAVAEEHLSDASSSSDTPLRGEICAATG